MIFTLHFVDILIKFCLDTPADLHRINTLISLCITNIAKPIAFKFEGLLQYTVQRVLLYCCAKQIHKKLNNFKISWAYVHGDHDLIGSVKEKQNITLKYTILRLSLYIHTFQRIKLA
jgi:hypothetical protein